MDLPEIHKTKLIATDLDGTFLDNDKSISGRNLEALKDLGEKRIVRVAATGRNLRKVQEVIPRSVPFDYVIFSSGAGILNWQTGELLIKQNIPADTAAEITNLLIGQKQNFNAFQAVPDNHFLWYHRGGEPCEEFERYFAFHKSFATRLPKNGLSRKSLCQFLVILPDNPDLFFRMKEKIESGFENIGVIRSTSPLGTGFIWMEIFHRNVCKGNALKFLCKRLAIDFEHTVSIGNDYNDSGMLEFARYSFIVENAPVDLKENYHVAPSNEESAFAFAASRILKSS